MVHWPADALTANELTLQDSEKHTKAERTAFVDGALGCGLSGQGGGWE